MSSDTNAAHYAFYNDTDTGNRAYSYMLSHDDNDHAHFANAHMVTHTSHLIENKPDISIHYGNYPAAHGNDVSPPYLNAYYDDPYEKQYPDMDHRHINVPPLSSSTSSSDYCAPLAPVPPMSTFSLVPLTSTVRGPPIVKALGGPPASKNSTSQTKKNRAPLSASSSLTKASAISKDNETANGHDPSALTGNAYASSSTSSEAKLSKAETSISSHSSKIPMLLAPDYTLNPAGPASSESIDFKCPQCDKVYKGKHARSIWRRHLQDKHGIPLAQQPRRTRWDNDANRPKSEEERRARTLDSKRRWAKKNRGGSQVNGADGSGSAKSASFDGDGSDAGGDRSYETIGDDEWDEKSNHLSHQQIYNDFHSPGMMDPSHAQSSNVIHEDDPRLITNQLRQGLPPQTTLNAHVGSMSNHRRDQSYGHSQYQQQSMYEDPTRNALDSSTSSSNSSTSSAAFHPQSQLHAAHYTQGRPMAGARASPSYPSSFSAAYPGTASLTPSLSTTSDGRASLSSGILPLSPQARSATFSRNPRPSTSLKPPREIGVQSSGSRADGSANGGKRIVSGEAKDEAANVLLALKSSRSSPPSPIIRSPPSSAGPALLGQDVNSRLFASSSANKLSPRKRAASASPPMLGTFVGEKGNTQESQEVARRLRHGTSGARSTAGSSRNVTSSPHKSNSGKVARQQTYSQYASLVATPTPVMRRTIDSSPPDSDMLQDDNHFISRQGHLGYEDDGNDLEDDDEDDDDDDDNDEDEDDEELRHQKQASRDRRLSSAVNSPTHSKRGSGGIHGFKSSQSYNNGHTSTQGSTTGLSSELGGFALGSSSGSSDLHSSAVRQRRVGRGRSGARSRGDQEGKMLPPHPQSSSSMSSFVLSTPGGPPRLSATGHSGEPFRPFSLTSSASSATHPQHDHFYTTGGDSSVFSSSSAAANPHLAHSHNGRYTLSYQSQYASRAPRGLSSPPTAGFLFSSPAHPGVSKQLGLTAQPGPGVFISNVGVGETPGRQTHIRQSRHTDEDEEEEDEDELEDDEADETLSTRGRADGRERENRTAKWAGEWESAKKVKVAPAPLSSQDHGNGDKKNDPTDFN